jgi:hypothetical protein
MPITKIISGGQTGADQAGLHAAHELGIKTGGFMPRDYMTEAGRWLDAEAFGMMQIADPGYRLRTKMNVQASDATLWFGHTNSPGYKATTKFALDCDKRYYVINWPRCGILGPKLPAFLGWLRANNISTLNVAGNRESSNSGIFYACRTFLISAIDTHNKGIGIFNPDDLPK